MAVAATRVAHAAHLASKRGGPLWKPSIAFLGYGVMAKAMTVGFQKAPTPLFSRYVLCDSNESALLGAEQAFSSAPVTIAQSPQDAVAHAEVVVLAVKPQGLDTLLASVPVTKDHLVISIVAGWPIDQILDCLPKSGNGIPRVIRCMPNTPLQVGKGCTLFARCKRSSEADADLVMRMFSSCGICAELKENQLDAATGVAGSGPAFVAVFMEALADGAVKVGIPRDLALKLAAHTVEGAALMCTDGGGGLHPAVLKDRVSSPGGTSIHGVTELENHGLRAAVIAAVSAATQRSKELASKL
jgi:pyrroline-5-carboxylate reductase